MLLIDVRCLKRREVRRTSNSEVVSDRFLRIPVFNSGESVVEKERVSLQ